VFVVTVATTTWVCSFVNVTVAPDTAAPALSVTVPVTREVVPCPEALAAKSTARAKTETVENSLLIDMLLLQRFERFITSLDENRVYRKKC
jgi:hypothetical protein